MNYATVDFMEVRKLVLQYELESPVLPTRLDDSSLFQSSDEVHRVKLAICNLRERALAVKNILSLAPKLKEYQMQNFIEKGSIWVDEAILPEVLSMVPVAVFHCPDLLSPEILVNAVLTTKYAGSLLKECCTNISILRRPCLEMLADFIQIGRPRHSDPLLRYCLLQSHNAMESICLSDPQGARVLRDILVQRCICPNMIIKVTVDVLNDVVDFMTRIFFSDGEISQWILSCIRSTRRSKEIFSTSEVEKVGKATDPPTAAHSIDAFELKEQTVLKLRKALQVGAEAAFNEDGWHSNLYSRLRLYCVLVHVGGLKPNQEEVVFWLRLLCITDSPGGDAKHPGRNVHITKHRFELGISFLLLIPGFRDSSLTENMCRECLLYFLGPVIYGLPPFEQGFEIALWLVVQLLLQCNDKVSEYCSKAIGMNIRIDSACWAYVLRLAHEAGITSNSISIAKAARILRPIGPLSTTNRLYGFVSDDVVIECLFQLLKSGLLVQNGVDISETIMHCILSSNEPIHPMLGTIIDIYAKASCTPTSDNAAGAYEMHPLRLDFLALAIKPFCSCFRFLELALEERAGDASSRERISSSSFTKTKSAAVAVLASFYILCREKWQRNEGTCISNFSFSSTCTSDDGVSWSMLLRFLPLDKLLAHMDSHSHSYEHIFTQWAGLAMSLFPELLRVPDLVQSLEESEGDYFANKGKYYQFEEHISMLDEDLQEQNVANEEEVNIIGRDFSVDSVQEVLRNASVNAGPALKLLKTISGQNSSDKDKVELQIAIVEDMVPLLLDNSCSPLQEAFCVWWYSLDKASTQVLIPLFCVCIKNSDMDIDERSLSSICDAKSLSNPNLYQELVEQPLSILTCRMEVYVTPLISIFLDILGELLARNRQMCLSASSNDGDMKKDEILRAVDTRDSAVCQILLENWSRMPSLGVTTASVLKAGSVICSFISSLFYLRPSVFRVVHFQGYDMKLIPAIVKGVTLTSHFIGFLEDSLKFLELPMLPFMVVLISNIIRKYPSHSRSLPAAHKVVTHLRSIASESFTNFSIEVLEAVAWFAITFPSLESEVREFLKGCSEATNSSKSNVAQIQDS